MVTMKLSDYSMMVKFDILGIWYLKESGIDDGLKGILHYDEESITLELFDSFGELFIDREKYSQIDTIYGFSQNGKHLVLNNCFSTKTTSSMPGFSITNYVVSSFFILEIPFEDGYLGTDLDQVFDKISSDGTLLVESLEFSTNHLDAWLRSSVLESVYVPREGSTRFASSGFQCDLGKFEPKKYHIASCNAVLRDGVRVNSNVDPLFTLGTLNNRAYLELSSLDGVEREFSDLFDIVKSIKQLMELLNASALNFEYLEFICKTMEVDDLHLGKHKLFVKGRYFYKQVSVNNSNPKFRSRFIIPEIDSKFEDVLNQWFDKKEELDFIIGNYLNDLHLPNYYTETKLLNSLRSLEIYYRNFVNHKNRIDDQEVIDNCSENLIKFITEQIPEEHQKYFLDRIMYVGEDSLNKKLVYLLKNLPDELFDKLMIDEGKKKSKVIKSFIYSLVQTRNFYTHGDNAELYPKRISGGINLFHANNKVRKIVEYYIFKEVGLQEDVIMKNLLK